MDTFFASYDPAYTWIALGVVAFDQLVLSRVLSFRTWCLLRLPSTILHEFAHWLVAAMLLGSPRISLTPRSMPDGSVAIGWTQWNDLLLGNFGKKLVGAAPLGWFVVASLLAKTHLSQPQGFLTGMGWLFVTLIVAGSGLRLSISDMRNIGWTWNLAFVLLWLSVVMDVAMRIPKLLCGSLGLACGVSI